MSARLLVGPVAALALLAAGAGAQGTDASRETTGVTGVDRTLLADTLFFPEGLDVDLRTGTLYVTSLRHRNVLVVRREMPGDAQRDANRDAPSAPRWLLAPSNTPHGAVFGVAIDTSTSTAWLTTGVTPHMRPTAADAHVKAELLRVSLETGVITRRWTLGEGDGMPGEMAFSPEANGDVFVSDGLRSRLYRLRADADSLEVIEHAALRSPQGIAVRPDGAVAYVADWSRGILRWDLHTNDITPVQSPSGSLVRGVDGLRWWRGKLIGIQNGAVPHRVVLLELNESGQGLAAAELLDAPQAPLGEGTVGAVVGAHFVYVATSAWPFYTEEGERKAHERALPPVMVREVPLTP